jgi:hypothetical protein
MQGAEQEGYRRSIGIFKKINNFEIRIADCEFKDKNQHKCGMRSDGDGDQPVEKTGVFQFEIRNPKFEIELILSKSIFAVL